jgi:hypothetical protein
LANCHRSARFFCAARLTSLDLAVLRDMATGQFFSVHTGTIRHAAASEQFGLAAEHSLTSIVAHRRQIVDNAGIGNYDYYDDHTHAGRLECMSTNPLLSGAAIGGRLYLLAWF